MFYLLPTANSTKGMGNGGYSHFRPLHPATPSSLHLPPSPAWVFSMGYCPAERNHPSMGPHGLPFLPESLLLYEHIHLLQLKLCTGCLWFFTGYRVPHYKASSVDYVGLSSFPHWPHLGSAGRLTFISLVSHTCCWTAFFFYPALNMVSQKHGW